MSRDNRDQKGGHHQRERHTKSCGCCLVVSPTNKNPDRTVREREAMANELGAETTQPPWKKTKNDRVA